MVNKKILFIVLVAILFIGCTPEKEEEYAYTQDENGQITDLLNSRYFKGKLSSEFTESKSGVNSRALSDIGDISQIIAIAVKNGSADLDKTKTASVQSDGSFSVEFDKNEDKDIDWIMMMENPNASTPEERLGNFISLSEGNLGLSSIPMGEATGNINAGTLSANGDETTSTNSITDISANLSIDSNTLLDMTGLDSTNKSVKNTYINTDKVSNITWSLNHRYSATNYLQKNVNVSPSTYKIENYGLYFNTNKLLEDDIKEICNETKVLKLIPPEDVSYNDVIYNSEKPFQNLNITQSTSGSTLWCSADQEGGYLTVIYGSDNDAWRIGVNTIKGSTEGYWKIQYGEETIAIYDLDVGDIYDKDGDLSIIFPSYRINVDDNLRVSSIVISWYMYNKTFRNYEQITDVSLLNRFSNKFIFNINGCLTYDSEDKSCGTNSSDTNEGESIEYSNYEFIYTPENEFYWLGHGDSNKITLTGITMDMYFSGDLSLSIQASDYE